MRTRTLALLLSMLGLVGGAAGCGDGGGEELSASDYRAEANEICREGNERIEALTGDLENAFEDSEAPTEEELRDALGPMFDEIRSQIDDVRDLEGPADLDADVDAALDDADEALDDLEARFEADPLAAIQSDEDPFADVNARMTELGLDDCAD